MSKRRHRNRREEPNLDNNKTQQTNNYPFGINPNQLLSLFGNIDMNQINRMLQSFSGNGIDFNNLNLGPFENFMSGMTNGNTSDNLNKVKSNNEKNNNVIERDSEIDESDENIQMLVALKSIVNAERVSFIEKIIKMYEEGAFEE